MSDMVERTLTALPGLFLQNQLGGPAASRAPFFSRLGGLIRGVTALSSKHVCGGSAGRDGVGRRGRRQRSAGWTQLGVRPKLGFAACTDLRGRLSDWRP